MNKTIDFKTLKWLNEPLSSEVSDDILRVRTRNATDFWQRTFYGFRRSTGHFLFKEVQGDFTASVRFTGKYEALYDQAGLMMRLDDEHWVKAGIEYTDGERNLSAVVTNQYSDWSILPYRHAEEEVSIRLSRHGEAVRVQYANPADGRWTMTRLAYLPPQETVQIGIMCCSPEREGFEAIFRDFKVGPAISRELHDS